MTQHSHRKYHHALLASEQLMPNLECALALAKQDRLATVHIYFTDNERKSAIPARQIAILLKKVADQPGWPQFKIHLSDTPGGLDVQNVHQWLHKLMNQHPDDMWVLNATGGLKLMSAAFMSLAGHPAIQHVFYREIGAGWRHLRHTPAGLCSEDAEAQLPGLNEASQWLDEFDLAELMEAQFGAENIKFRTQSDPIPLDSEAITNCLKDNPSIRISTAFEQANQMDLVPHTDRDGLLYEYLLVDLLRIWNLSHLIHSLELTFPMTGTASQEIDVILMHRGKILLLDLKLRDENDHRAAMPYDQIRTAANTVSTLGGLNASIFMLRPNWIPSDERRSYAQSNRVRLLDPVALPRLFELIRYELKLDKEHYELTGGMRNLQAYYQSCAEVGHLPATATTSAMSRVHGSSIISLDSELKRSMELRDANWVAAKIRAKLHIFLFEYDGSNDTASPLLKLLRSEKEQNSKELHWVCKPSGTGQTALLELDGFAKSRMAGFVKSLPKRLSWSSLAKQSHDKGVPHTISNQPRNNVRSGDGRRQNDRTGPGKIIAPARGGLSSLARENLQRAKQQLQQHGDEGDG